MWWPPNRSSRSPQASRARVEIEAGDAPARSLADVAVEGDQEGRPAVALHHPRGDDADHAGMPAIAREHEAGIALRVGGPLDLLQRLVEDALVQRLPLDVEPLQPPRQRGGLRRVVAEQQPEPVGGVSDPAGGVEPGTENEAEVAGADLLAGEPGRLDQRAHAGQRLSASSLRPCFTRIRFSPWSGTTSATVASATRSSRWNGRLAGRPSAGTSAWTSLKATPVPQSPVGPETSSGRCGSTTAMAGGSSAPGQVVIGDYHADAGRPRRAHRLHRGDAAVAGDDQRGPGGRAASRPAGPKS